MKKQLGIERQHFRNATKGLPCVACRATGRLYRYRPAGSEEEWVLACDRLCFGKAQHG